MIESAHGLNEWRRRMSNACRTHMPKRRHTRPLSIEILTCVSSETAISKAKLFCLQSLGAVTMGTNLWQARCSVSCVLRTLTGQGLTSKPKTASERAQPETVLLRTNRILRLRDAVGRSRRFFYQPNERQYIVVKTDRWASELMACRSRSPSKS